MKACEELEGNKTILLRSKRKLTSTIRKMTSGGRWKLECVTYHALINRNEQISNVCTWCISDIYHDSHKITIANIVQSSYLVSRNVYVAY